MSKKMPWIERRFSFDLPLSMFPNILERLRGTPARIEDRIRGIPADVLRTQSGESWSIQQIIGHLIQVESLWLFRLDDFEAGRATLRAADMTNRATNDANYNQEQCASLLGTFRDARELFVRRLESLGEDGIARSARHPRLDQPMRVIDLMVFAAEHDDHHLARITELLRMHGATT